MPSSIVRFRPAGPWRFGPDTGARDRTDLIYHSDSLYAAVSSAMLRLGLLEEWLDATVRRQDAEPDVRFSSMFPFQRNLLFVAPPCSLWPPPPSTKIRYKSARFVPMSVVQSLVAEQNIDENRWIIDGESQCMIPSGEGPFRIGLRAGAAVDRVSRAAIDTHATACLEFSRDAGLWTTVVFSSDDAQDRWRTRVKNALRLLADSGFGGERSRGWGRSSDPEWSGPRDLLNWSGGPDTPTAYWLLSLYAPAASDGIDWNTGNYSTVTRTGRVESAANWGAVKTPTLMIGEGSVLIGPQGPRGEARDVAPAGSAHAVYRAGFAVALPIPWRAPKPHTVAEPAAVPKPSREPAAAEPVTAGSQEQELPVAPQPEPPATPREEPSEEQTQPLLAQREPQPLLAQLEPQPLVPEQQPEALKHEPAPLPLMPASELEALTAEPDAASLSAAEESQPLAPETEPQQLAPEPEPRNLAAEAEPQPLVASQAPSTLAPEPEPRHLAPEAEPENLSAEVEPQPLVASTAPSTLAPEPEPPHLAPEAEPRNLTSEAEPQPLVPSTAPSTLTPEPEPPGLAPQPEPERLEPQAEPAALSPAAEPKPLAPAPDQKTAEEPEPDDSSEPESGGRGGEQ